MYDFLKQLHENSKEKEFAFLFPSYIVPVTGIIEEISQSKIAVLSDPIKGKKCRFVTHPDNIVLTQIVIQN